MNNDVISLIDESINLELNVSYIYFIFSELFPDDAKFWRDLVLEEKNHAAIFRSAKDVLTQLKIFPHNLLYHNLQDLKDTNSTLHSLIKSFKNTPPSREEAFNIALKIEISASELHFQDFMDEETNSELVQFFQKLNKNDKDHAVRIRSYMDNHGIPVQPK
jgi:ferritin